MTAWSDPVYIDVFRGLILYSLVSAWSDPVYLDVCLVSLAGCPSDLSGLIWSDLLAAWSDPGLAGGLPGLIRTDRL